MSKNYSLTPLFRVGQRVRLATPLGVYERGTWAEVTKATWSSSSGWYYTVRIDSKFSAQAVHQSALYLDAVTQLGELADGS